MRSLTSLTIGILSQPGRLGGDITTPVALESGPPQLMPIAPVFCAVRPWRAIISQVVESRFSIVSGAEVVSKRILSAMRGIPSSRIPYITAHLVPPMSRPKIFCVITVKYLQD